MPTVQYIYKGETYTRQMPTPKQVTKVEAWYKEARKVLPNIPEAQIGVVGNNKWMIEHYETDPKWIKYDLMNGCGEKAYIVILRK